MLSYSAVFPSMPHEESTNKPHKSNAVPTTGIYAHINDMLHLITVVYFLVSLVHCTSSPPSPDQNRVRSFSAPSRLFTPNFLQPVGVVPTVPAVDEDQSSDDSSNNSPNADGAASCQRPVPIIHENNQISYLYGDEPFHFEQFISSPTKLVRGKHIPYNYNHPEVRKRSQLEHMRKAEKHTLEHYKPDIVEVENFKDGIHRLHPAYIKYLNTDPLAGRKRAAMVDVLFLMAINFNSEHYIDAFHTSVSVLDKYLLHDVNHGNQHSGYLVIAGCFTIAAKLVDDISFDEICDIFDLIEGRFLGLNDGPLGVYDLDSSKEQFYQLETEILNVIHHDLPIRSPLSVIDILTGEFVVGLEQSLQKPMTKLALFLFNSALMEPGLCGLGMSMLAHGCSLLAYHHILDKTMLPSDSALAVSKVPLSAYLECASRVIFWLLHSNLTQQRTEITKSFINTFGARTFAQVISFLDDYHLAD